jgi:hypothetical protein
MLSLIKSNFRNFRNIGGIYFKQGKNKQYLVNNNTTFLNFDLKFFSTLNFNKNSSGSSSSSSGSSSSSSDEDFELDKKMLKKEAKEIELHDKSILKSQNFKKYFSINEEGEIIPQEEDYGQEVNIFGEEDREAWINAIKNIEGTQDKLKTLLEIIEKQIFIKLAAKSMIKAFKLEEVQKYTPPFLLKPEIKLSIDEIKFILLDLYVLLSLGDNVSYIKYEPLVSDYIDFYMNNLDKCEIISFKDFMFLMKMNASLRFEKLDHLLISGLNSIFNKSFDENSFNYFINNNPEYKQILKYFPLFCEYFSRCYFLHKDRFTYIFDNILESMVNLKKYYVNDIEFLCTVTDYINKVNTKIKNNLTNLNALVLVLHEGYQKVQLKTPDSFQPFVSLTINYFHMMRNEELEIENFEPTFEKLQEALVIYNRNFLSGNVVFNLIQKLSAFVIARVENFNVEFSLKMNEHIKIILNQTYERWDYHKKLYKDYMYLYLCVILRCLIYITANKPSKRSAAMILKLTEDFRNKVDQAECPLALIDTLQICRRVMPSEEKHMLVDKINNKLFVLKDQNFHVLNEYLATLFRIDVYKKGILQNLKVDYMNKLYIASLTGQLFTKDLNLDHLLENLRQFTHKHIIRESVNVKRNMAFTFDEGNLICDEEMEEIKKGRHTLSDSDIGNLLDKIYMQLLENKNKLSQHSTNTGFIDNLYHLTSNSLNRDYLFEKYYLSVLYPLMSANSSMLITFQQANSSFNFLTQISQYICNLENPGEVMTYHLKLMCRSLVIAMKFSKNQPKENNEILIILNKFYKLYTMNPYYYEEVERNHKKLVFLRFILRKRFLIGRALKDDGPVKIFRAKDKIVADKTNELTDNYFFG